MKPTVLWVGDAVCASGFSRVTHKVCDELHKECDVHILGMSYFGDPHEYPYKIWPCMSGGDPYGIGRLPKLIQKLKPSAVVILNDPWNFPTYLSTIGREPVVGIVAVDGLNCRGSALNGLADAIFWTDFADRQAEIGGYTGPSTVVPLGVDLEQYRPQDRTEVRTAMRLPEVLADRGMDANAFIVGVVGRNQQRKRLDLTIEYFADWIHTHDIRDAMLWLHVAPTGEKAYDLWQLCGYYDIRERVIIPELDMFTGMTEDQLCRVYNAFDVGLTTTQGEGFGLTTFEMMACGIPMIVPRWSALEELTEGAAYQVSCSTHSTTTNAINSIGGVPDRDATIEALHKMYMHRGIRDKYATLGLQRVMEPRFRWESVTAKMAERIQAAMGVASHV